MRKMALVAAVAATTVGGAALADASEPASGAATKRVAVDDYFFKSKSVAVKRGGVVTWIWRGSDDHNVVFTSAPRRVKKPKRCGTRSSGKCSRRFRRRGTYRYVCTLHASSMTGKVRVR